MKKKRVILRRRISHNRHLAGRVEIMQHAAHCPVCRVWVMAQLEAGLKALKRLHKTLHQVPE